MRYYHNHSDIGQQADQYSAHVLKLILTWEAGPQLRGLSWETNLLDIWCVITS